MAKRNTTPTLSASERAALHEQVARALQNLAEDDTDPDHPLDDDFQRNRRHIRREYRAAVRDLLVALGNHTFGLGTYAEAKAAHERVVAWGEARFNR